MAGARLNPSVSVAVQDFLGNTKPVTTTVTLTVLRAGSLVTSMTAEARDGVAVFSDFHVDRAGRGYTAVATAAELDPATSDPFDVAPAAKKSLAFVTGPPASQPAGALAAIEVSVVDAFGNVVTAAADTVSLTLEGSGTLTGDTTVSASAGRARFDALSLSDLGSGYVLVASSDGLDSARSDPFDIVAGAADHLVFDVQPPAVGVAGQPLTPAVRVRIEDAVGNLVDGATTTVSISLVGLSTLSGTTISAATGGVATFSDLRVDQQGNGFTLVASASGLAGATSAAFDVVFIPAPVVTSFAPTSQSPGANVTITGTNLMNATSVTFGGGPAAAITANTATSITATVPGGSASGSVSVSTPGGSSALAGFTYIPKPVISGFSPTTRGANKSVVISGTDLANATIVTFGGGPSASISANTAGSITVTVPPGSASGSVSVTTPLGTATKSGFTFVPAPTLSGFTPTTQAAGYAVTITGTNLSNATSVTFGGGPDARIVSNTASSIVVVVPTGSVSGSVSVTTEGGTTSLAGYTVLSNAWSTNAAPGGHHWLAVAWSPDLHLFAAVSSDGQSSAHGWNRVMTSPDGVSWTSRDAPEATWSTDWSGITWSHEQSLFVAVGSSRIMTSPDGTTWTERTTPAGPSSWQSVAWSPSLGLFAAVSYDGGVMTSSNGVSWAPRTSPSHIWQEVTWSPELGRFVAVGTDYTMTSVDGLTWTETNKAGAWRSIVWAPELSLFVAVADGGSSRVMTSPDGSTWTTRTSTIDFWTSVAWSPELRRFVAVGYNANRVMVSADGIVWSDETIPQASGWYSICWSSERLRFVGVSYDGANQVLVSK